MESGTATPPRRGRRKLIVAGLLGGLVGAIVIFFFVRIHDPFGRSLASPLVLVPEDVDFLIDVPDFPRTVRELPEADFLARLESHPGAQRFLKSPFVTRTGIVSSLKQAFAEIDRIDASLPLDLNLLGDVSGQRVLLGGFEEGVTPGEPDFIAVIQPDSWLTLAAANVLLDEWLAGQFLVEPLEQQGITIAHGRDVVTLTPRGSRPLHLIRVADAIVVATDQGHLARMFKAIATRGLPVTEAPRFQRLAAGGLGDAGRAITAGRASGGQRVRLLARASTADGALDLSQTLRDLWGQETLEMATGLLPPIAEGDVLLEVSLGFGLQLDLEFDKGSTTAPGLARRYRTFSRDDLDRSLQQCMTMLSEEVFGLWHTRLTGDEFLDALLDDLGVLDANTSQLIDESLSEVRGIGGFDGLRQLLRDSSGTQCIVGFFRQPREPLNDEAEPGVLLAVELRDASRMRERLDRVATELRQAARLNENAAVREVVTAENRGVFTMGFDLAAGVVSDDRVTKPGLAISGDWLFVTNFHPFLVGLREGRNPRLETRQGLSTAASGSPRSLQTAILLDGSALFPWLDQSVEGWATKQSRPNQATFVAWVQEGERVASAQGLRRGTRSFDAAVDRYVNAQEKASLARFPQELARFRQRVDEFRGLLQGVGIFLEEGALDARLRVRIDLTNDAEDGGR